MILFHPLYYNIHLFSSLYCFVLLSQSQKIKAAWFDKFIQHIYFSIVFSYMGGANFWGGTKEDDVSIGRKKLLVPVTNICIDIKISLLLTTKCCNSASFFSDISGAELWRQDSGGGGRVWERSDGHVSRDRHPAPQDSAGLSLPPLYSLIGHYYCTSQKLHMGGGLH